MLTSEIISAALIPASACWLTLLSLPRVGVLKAKVFSMYCYLFIHPLCALSAFESLSCSQAAILRDLRKGPGWSCDRVSSGAHSSKNGLVFIFIRECCLQMVSKT